MIKILINDGIHPKGEAMLKAAGFEVNTTKVAQEDLAKELPNYEVICAVSYTHLTLPTILLV